MKWRGKKQRRILNRLIDAIKIYKQKRCGKTKILIPFKDRFRFTFIRLIFMEN